MFYVQWPNCDARIEVLPDAVSPERTDVWNVHWCDQCGVTLDYDDEEVLVENPSPFTDERG
ncbi:MAG: hypothetical protein JNK76_08535 [Planctomycetales bacterium]|nr:hypothetical protein [Planctomycetales bacterium]